MQLTYYILLGFAIVVAIIFALLIYFTGKGDAMGGSGGSVRTTFKGKAGFDDYISRLTLIMGAGFMALMLILDVLNSILTRNGRG